MPALVAASVGYLWFGGVFGSPQTAAFVFAAIPVIGYFVVLWRRAPQPERAPIAALLSIFAVVVVFWMIFHQNGSSLTYWAEENTRREAGVLAPVLRSVYMDQDATIAPGSDPDAVGSYWRNVPEADRPPVGERVTLISTELFQSINPFFVLFLTPLVVGFFGWLGRRGREPSTPAKLSWGMFVTAISVLFMLGAVWAAGGGRASPWWLVGTYGVVTLGELCLSPMGLALVSKMAPKRVTGLMMGGWFLATAIGNKLAGVLAGFWELLPLSAIFGISMVAALVAAGVIAALTPWIRRVMHEAGVD